MNTSIKLIRLFSDSGTLRHYAVYLQLKHLHSNGCIYNYNVNKLSQKSGLSRNSIKKYIKFFLDNKWCTMHGDNLCFISYIGLRKLYGITLKHTIRINAGKTQTVLNNLRYELLKQKTRQFNYLKGISNDLHNPTGNFALESHKKALKLSLKYKLPAQGESAIKISLKTISNVLNLSSASSYNLIKLKRCEGKATIIKDQYKRSSIRYNIGAQKYANNGYFKGGYLYTVSCNRYVFS